VPVTKNQPGKSDSNFTALPSSEILKDYKDLYLREYREKASEKKKDAKGKSKHQLKAKHKDQPAGKEGQQDHMQDQEHTAPAKKKKEHVFEQEERLEKQLDEIDSMEAEILKIRNQVADASLSPEKGMRLLEETLLKLSLHQQAFIDDLESTDTQSL
jgi:hypothetical protein